MSTVATMRPAATVFHEEQYFDWRVYALIAALELVAGYCLVWVTRHWGPVAALLAHRWSIEFSLGRRGRPGTAAFAGGLPAANDHRGDPD